MSLSDLRDGVVAALKAALPATVSVEAHGGRFDLAELKRWGAKAPALRVALLGVEGALREHSGQAALQARVGVFVLTRDTAAVPRDKAALLLVDSVLNLAPDNRWGVAGAQMARDMRADNLFAGDLDQTGMALWAVTWRQLMLEGGLDAAALADFSTLDATYQQPGSPAAPAEDHQTGLSI